jgi:hypothetical protein
LVGFARNRNAGQYEQHYETNARELELIAAAEQVLAKCKTEMDLETCKWDIHV